MTFSSSSFRQLSDGTGVVLGQGTSTDAVGFYGAAPLQQISVGANAFSSLASTVVQVSTFNGNVFVFANSSQAGIMQAICAQLVSTGLFRLNT